MQTVPYLRGFILTTQSLQKTFLGFLIGQLFIFQAQSATFATNTVNVFTPQKPVESTGLGPHRARNILVGPGASTRDYF